MPKPPRDLSVQTSLKELLELEEARIRKEAADSEERARTEAGQRADVERAKEAAVRARDEAQAQARALAEAHARDEAVRIEAIRQAIVERERALTDARIRREAEERALLSRAYDEARAQNPRERRARAPVAAAILAATLAFAGSGGAYAGLVVPKVSQLENERLRLENENRRLAGELDVHRREDLTQQQRLEKARADLERLEQRIVALQIEMKTIQASRHGAAVTPTHAASTTKVPEKCVYDSDPMCFKIGN